MAEEKGPASFVASRIARNEKVEQLAANNLTIPQDAIASLLQRLVLPTALPCPTIWPEPPRPLQHSLGRREYGDWKP